MSRKTVEARRQRNRELGAADAAKRCSYCHGPIGSERWESFLTDGAFCSEHCLRASEELERLKAEYRR